ncbi:MAG: ABC transporter ATP-binding protein [Opitutae bacterium]|nr:ABC transporter ATP-binding protein [Opitutae bacterium]
MNLPSGAPALRLERVVKDFALDWRGRTARALDDVTLSVARGAICALVGANGSGKSTLLKLCAGLVAATRGRCEIAGLAPRAAVRRGLVAYLPEETLLPDFGSAREFLRRLALVGGLESRAADAAVEDALAQTDLVDIAMRPLASLSKGQRQRVGLAQALLRSPGLLLLDEPASGLDPRAQAALRALLATQRAAGRTVVLSAHFLPHCEELCDQFVLFDRGRVLFDGDGEVVVARGGLEQIYLDATPA